MSIFKLLILSLLLFVGCVPAHAVGLQVEAGNYRTANNDDLLFDTKHYGSAAGKIQSESLSIAARGVHRTPSGFEFGLGVRGGSVDYKAAMGAQAAADHSHNVGEARLRQEAIDALDKTLPDYEDQVKALESEMQHFNSVAQSIESEHEAFTDQVGASLTAMKYTHTQWGGDIGFGAEAYVGDSVVPAAKVSYRSPIVAGSPNFGVNAVVGDDWAGANLSLDF